MEASFGDDEGVKTSWLILVPKAGSIVSSGNLVSTVDVSFTSVFGFESELIVRTGEGKGSMYSPMISSSSDMDKMKSSSLDFFSTSTKAIISLCCF